jgi:hypothetical protein
MCRSRFRIVCYRAGLAFAGRSLASVSFDDFEGKPKAKPLWPKTDDCKVLTVGDLADWSALSQPGSTQDLREFVPEGFRHSLGILECSDLTEPSIVSLIVVVIA